MTIGELFRLILPVFALIAVGVVLRRIRWIEGPAETSLFRLAVYVCMPCLAFDTIVGNPALRNAGNIVLPPLAGFATTIAGVGVAYLAGRWIGLERRDRASDLRLFGRGLQLLVPALSHPGWNLGRAGPGCHARPQHGGRGRLLVGGPARPDRRLAARRMAPPYLPDAGHSAFGRGDQRPRALRLRARLRQKRRPFARRLRGADRGRHDRGQRGQVPRPADKPPAPQDRARRLCGPPGRPAGPHARPGPVGAVVARP